MKLFELRRELQDALDDSSSSDEDRELSPADVDRFELRIRDVLVKAWLIANRATARRRRAPRVK